MSNELAPRGALRMLAAALQALWWPGLRGNRRAHGGVDEHGYRLVVRNGSHAPRQVATAAGMIPVKVPLVNDKRVDPV